MPEKAKIFLAEDYDPVRMLEKMSLTDQGHTIEVEATSLEEALASVKTAKEKGVNVAVLDGHLSQGSWKADGKIIAEALREEIPGIKIVSCSSLTQDWGDINLPKEGYKELGIVVKSL